MEHRIVLGNAGSVKTVHRPSSCSQEESRLLTENKANTNKDTGCGVGDERTFAGVGVLRVELRVCGCGKVEQGGWRWQRKR